MRVVTAPRVYVSVDGDAQGPFTPDELSSLWRAGELDASARYWFRGMVGWLPVSDFAPPTTGLVPSERVLVTTAHAVAQRGTVQELDVVGAEVVLTRDLFADQAVALRDVVGGRSSTLQRAMRDARQACLDELRAEASRIGGDAVIAVALTYAPIGTGAASVMVVATGTAVQLGPPPM